MRYAGKRATSAVTPDLDVFNRQLRDYPLTGHDADMPKSTRMTRTGLSSANLAMFVDPEPVADHYRHCHPQQLRGDECDHPRRRDPCECVREGARHRHSRISE